MEIEIIKANDQNVVARGRKIDRLRVAAYCRVSTDEDEQIKSYNSMVKYYTDLIKNNKDWVYAGVYADRAITGTKVDKREEFQRLIHECMNGNIDLVLAKSIPRFARNTLDTLKYVRLLKERNIGVYFEVEKINTLKDGEFLMTILSSVAQQEVENTSAYVKKGLKMKMRRGEMVGFQGCLGYDYDPKTKSLSINPEGAEVVKYIFERYVAGAGGGIIARELNEQGITTLKGNKWTPSGVIGVIKNEKYKGDLLMGKTFTVDPISKRRLNNFGEEDRFYIHDHHEGIISEEMFDEAQRMRNRRNGSKKKAEPGKREKFSRQYALSCMMECGFCGSTLSRRSWHSGTKHQKTMWQCVTATKKGKRNCPDSKGVNEKVIENAFVESYKIFSTNCKDTLDEFLLRTENALNESSIELDIGKLEKEGNKLATKRKKLLDSYLNGVIEQDLYEEKDLEIGKEIQKINAQLKKLDLQLDEEECLQVRMQKIKETLETHTVLEEFDREVFESVIEKVIVGGYDENGNKDPYRITFVYKSGWKDSINLTKEEFTKKIDVGASIKKACSYISNEVNKACSNFTLQTC